MTHLGGLHLVKNPRTTINVVGCCELAINLQRLHVLGRQHDRMACIRSGLSPGHPHHA